MPKKSTSLSKSLKIPPKPLIQRGFTLVEILVVVAIISVLMTAVGPVFNSLATSQSPAAAASVVAGQLERARSHAIAKNTYVWVRFGQNAADANELNMSVWESIDGTDSIISANVRKTWKSPRLPNLAVGVRLTPAQLTRPAVTITSDTNWVRFSPRGECGFIKSNSINPPTGSGTSGFWTEFGLQCKRGSSFIPNEVAAVHLNFLTGQTRKFHR
jgi:prepilin-type N-terminal cleavage/methylation domain-containing protein